MSWRVLCAATLLCSALLANAAEQGTSPNPASRETMLSDGHKALRKGLHHKAYEYFRSAWRHSPEEAVKHIGLQEGLCVCSAKLKKETVAITACNNVTAIRSESASSTARSRIHAKDLRMAQGEAALFENKPVVAREHFRLAAEAAASGEAGQGVAA